MLGGGTVKSIHDLQREGHGIRSIAKVLGVSRNSVRKYLREPGLRQRSPRVVVSKLDPHKPYLTHRFRVDGVTNGAVLLREIRARGYGGGVSLLKDFLKAMRAPRAPKLPTERFETLPGEQAQVDFKTVTLVKRDGSSQQLMAFVMLLGWSRSLYVEFVEKADLAAFVACHIRAFEHFGGVPRRVLYDNTKLVILGRDDEGKRLWNERFVDFSLRVGFEVRLCRPYRPQTKGKVERAIRYVQDNFLPTAEPVHVPHLNVLARAWCVEVADVRLHATTLERPVDRLAREREALGRLPDPAKLAEFMRDERRVARDGFVSWGGCYYGVNCLHARQVVQVEANAESIVIWKGQERLAVHARGWNRGQRFHLPGQWEGLRTEGTPERKQSTVYQVADLPVEVRSLACYEAIAGGVN